MKRRSNNGSDRNRMIGGFATIGILFSFPLLLIRRISLRAAHSRQSRDPATTALCSRHMGREQDVQIELVVDGNRAEQKIRV